MGIKNVATTKTEMARYSEVNRELLGREARRCGVEAVKFEELLRCLGLRVDSRAAQRFFVSLRTHSVVAITMAIHTFLHRSKSGDIPERWSRTMRVKVFMSDVLKEDVDVVESADVTTEEFGTTGVSQAEMNVINDEADYERRRWNWEDI